MSNFGIAIEAAKAGKKIERSGWNGKNMHIGYVPAFDVEDAAAKAHDSWMASKRAGGVTSRISESGEELMVPYAELSEAAKDLDRNHFGSVAIHHAYLYMQGVDGKKFPWTPNMLDVLAEDWSVLG